MEYTLDSKTTRVEIIDSRGRSYSNRNCKSIELSLQDDGRTLKLFINDRKEKEEKE